MPRTPPKGWPFFTEVVYGEGLSDQDKANLRDWFNRYIQEGKLKETYPSVDWDAVVEAYVAGEEIPKVEVPEAYGFVSPEAPNKAIDKLISDVETATGITPEKIQMAGKPEWFAEMSDEDRDFFEGFISKMRADFEVLGIEVTPEHISDAQNYFNELVEAKNTYAETQGVDLTEVSLEEFLASEAGLVAVQAAGVELPESLAIVEDADRFNAALQEKLGAVPEEFKSFTGENFADLPPSLQRTFTDLLRQAVSDKANALAGESGRELQEISIEEVLSGLGAEDVEGIRQSALSDWLKTPEGQAAIPLATPLAQLQRVARYTGMSETEYLQSAYQDWKAQMHPEYIQQRGETALWSEFLGGPVVDYIERDITTTAGAVGREKETLRERLTPKYEYTPPQTTTRLTIKPSGERIAETVPVVTGAEGTWEKVAEQPPGGAPEGARPLLEISQEGAYSAYMKELEKRGYGPEDIRYLSGFFNQVMGTQWPTKYQAEDWHRFLETLNIPTPPKKGPRTRIIGGIR